MDSLRIARQKEESGIHKTAKDSNFDDIVGIATRDASPFEPPQRKRTGPEVAHDSEPAKRARMDDNQSSSRLPRYNDYPLHGGSNDEEAGRRPAPNLNSESSRVETNYGARAGGPSNEYSLATQSQSRSEGTPLRSPDVPASTGQAFMLPEGRAQEAMQLIGYHLTKFVLSDFPVTHGHADISISSVTVKITPMYCLHRCDRLPYNATLRTVSLVRTICLSREGSGILGRQNISSTGSSSLPFVTSSFYSEVSARSTTF